MRYQVIVDQNCALATGDFGVSYRWGKYEGELPTKIKAISVKSRMDKDFDEAFKILIIDKEESTELVDLIESLGVRKAGNLEAADVEDLQNLGNLLQKLRAKRFFRFVGLAT